MGDEGPGVELPKVMLQITPTLVCSLRHTFFSDEDIHPSCLAPVCWLILIHMLVACCFVQEWLGGAAQVDAKVEGPSLGD